eukprot:TRINITY_DN724_c0_g1_i6.p1 TRINITY_DN724_c0_g1~~TRINITY_DN724_c0_g1_i6.p1  ORF type:complete len:801 (-),score=90.86 TRINITY_DN724_c0_g1_i6:254-2656(-)
MKMSMPKFGFGKKKGDIDVDIPDVDINIEKPDLSVDGDVDLKMKKPGFDINLKKPDIDLNLKKPDFDINLKKPDIDMKMPKFGFGKKKGDLDVDLEGPEVDMDIGKGDLSVDGNADFNLKKSDYGGILMKPDSDITLGGPVDVGSDFRFTKPQFPIFGFGGKKKSGVNLAADPSYKSGMSSTFPKAVRPNLKDGQSSFDVDGLKLETGMKRPSLEANLDVHGKRPRLGFGSRFSEWKSNLSSFFGKKKDRDSSFDGKLGVDYYSPELQTPHASIHASLPKVDVPTNNVDVNVVSSAKDSNLSGNPPSIDISLDKPSINMSGGGSFSLAKEDHKNGSPSLSRTNLKRSSHDSINDQDFNMKRPKATRFDEWKFNVSSFFGRKKSSAKDSSSSKYPKISPGKKAMTLDSSRSLKVKGGADFEPLNYQSVDRESMKSLKTDVEYGSKSLKKNRSGSKFSWSYLFGGKKKHLDDTDLNTNFDDSEFSAQNRNTGNLSIKSSGPLSAPNIHSTPVNPSLSLNVKSNVPRGHDTGPEINAASPPLNTSIDSPSSALPASSSKYKVIHGRTLGEPTVEALENVTREFSTIISEQSSESRSGDFVSLKKLKKSEVTREKDGRTITTTTVQDVVGGPNFVPFESSSKTVTELKSSEKKEKIISTRLDPVSGEVITTVTQATHREGDPELISGKKFFSFEQEPSSKNSSSSTTTVSTSKIISSSQLTEHLEEDGSSHSAPVAPPRKSTTNLMSSSSVSSSSSSSANATFTPVKTPRKTKTTITSSSNEVTVESHSNLSPLTPPQNLQEDL